MGIISGFSFMIVGLPMPSAHCAVTISRLSRISTVVDAISVPSLNSIITIDMLLMDTDWISFTLLILAMACSTGSDTARSTSSGLAPAYVVITRAYGSSILGSRSVLIFRKDRNPNTKTITTATSTVSGRLTLYFDNTKNSPFILYRPAGETPSR